MSGASEGGQQTEISDLGLGFMYSDVVFLCWNCLHILITAYMGTLPIFKF